MREHGSMHHKAHEPAGNVQALTARSASLRRGALRSEDAPPLDRDCFYRQRYPIDRP